MSSGETQEASCGYSTRETNNGGGTRARILNRKGKWFNHSYLSWFGCRVKHARCGRVRIYRLRPHLHCSSPKASAKTLSQQENNNKADLRRGTFDYIFTSDYICTVANNSRGDVPSTILCQRPLPCGGRTSTDACGANPRRGPTAALWHMCGGMLEAMSHITLPQPHDVIHVGFQFHKHIIS